MDEFNSSSFFDYSSTATSSVDLNSSNTGSQVKQESFDSSVWIQGFTNIEGTNSFNGHSFSPIKNDFIDSLISNSDVSHTPSPVADPMDPLDMIFSPAVTEGVSLTTNSIYSNVKPDPDDVLLNALNAASSQSASQSTPSENDQLSTLPSDLVHVKQEPESTEVIPEDKTDGNAEVPSKESVKEIDPWKDLCLKITNVVTSFRVRCHLNLRKIAQQGVNVIYQKESKKIIMRIRKPSCTAYMWSSGKVVCTGASSEENAYKGSRKFAKRLQKLGFNVVFSGFKVVNVLAVCKMPFHINIIDFSQYYKSKYLSYEPEIHPAVMYRMPEFKVTFKIFSTGSITLTCPVVSRVPEAIKKVYPMVVDFFKLEKPNVSSSKLENATESEPQEISSGTEPLAS